MKISVIPALTDNYIYVIADGDDAVVVDPGDAAPVLAALAKGGLRLTAALITHRHADHIGGLSAIRAAHPGVAIHAPDGCGIPNARICGDGDVVRALGRDWRAIATPGHTLEHVAYVGEGAMFCGDALFVGGCGRVFEGTFRQMHDSLAALAAMPDDTAIYCGHDYACANLRFALAVEPDNADIRIQLRAAEDAAARGAPTAPGDLATERRTNPFLRTGAPDVIAAAEKRAGKTLPDGVAVFAALRRWKDEF